MTRKRGAEPGGGWLLAILLARAALAAGEQVYSSLSYTASTAPVGRTAGVVGINTAADVDPAWVMWIYRLGVNG